MAAAKIRIGGAWVDADITGQVRVAGAWVDFAPPGGTTYEAISWPAGPSDTDEADGDQAYNMGVAFTVAAGVDCVGVRWRVPDVVVNPRGGPHAIGLWDISESRIAYQEFTPVTGGEQDILFAADGPTALSASSYTVTVYTNHYVYSLANAAGEQSPSGNITAVAGRLVADNGGASSAPYPGSITTTLNFHISPLVAVP